MRLKTFTAPTMAAAMALVREQLGDDAIIVSTQRGEHGRGVRVTAALDGAAPDYAPGSPAPPPSDGGGGAAFDGDPIDILTERLDRHGAPSELTDRLMRVAGQLVGSDPIMVLAGAMDATFGFAPLLEERAPRAIMLIGPPGVGKTLTVAKLAARAVMAGKTPLVITADTVRAGAVEQLAAFTRVMKLELKTCDKPRQIMDAMASSDADMIFIDSPGTNPFSAEEMDELVTFTRVDRIEPILVLAAGGDVIEVIEIAHAFKQAGATRLLATKLDLSRRLGSILVAADSARLKFCDISMTAHVAQGLTPVNPLSLARILLPDFGKNAKATTGSKARI